MAAVRLFRRLGIGVWRASGCVLARHASTDGTCIDGILF